MEDKLFSVRDKICVITGGMGQLGAQYVKAFLSRGAKVAVFGRHVGEDKVQKVFEKDEYESPNLKFFQVDITSKSDLNKALDQMEEAWGTPDVLVNNAGIDTQPSAPPEVSGPFENFPEEVFREVVDVNLVGTFLTCQAVGARMVKAGKPGSIINVGSIYGMVSPVQDIYAYKEKMTGIPFVKPVAYSAAKSGIYRPTGERKISVSIPLRPPAYGVTPRTSISRPTTAVGFRLDGWPKKTSITGLSFFWPPMLPVI